MNRKRWFYTKPDVINTPMAEVVYVDTVRVF